MTTSFLATGAQPKTPRLLPLPELSVVTLARNIAMGAGNLPKGALGTIVHVYDRGKAYEVEFEIPFHAVVTLESGDLTA